MDQNDTLPQRLSRWAASEPDRLAIIAEDRSRVSFGQLEAVVESFTTKLLAAGVGPGNCVAVAVGNLSVRAALWFAILRVGATLCLTTTPADEMLAAGVPVDWAITPPDQPAERVRNLAFGRDWFHRPRGTIPHGPPGSTVLSSSGTTGAPKFMRLGPLALERRVALAEAQFPSQRLVVSGIGYATGAGARNLFGPLWSGAAVAPSHRDPERFLATCRAEGVAGLFLSPIHLRDLVTAVEAGVAAPALVEIRVAGGSLSADLAQRAAERFGATIRTIYGSTETGLSLSGSLIGHPHLGDGLIGPAVGWSEVRIVDNAGADLPAGASGRILIRVPEELRAVEGYGGVSPGCDAQGWFASGDLGRIGDDGWITVEGRQGDLINVGGNKYDPSYFEAVAKSVAGVVDAVAFATPGASGFDDVGIALVAGKDYRRDAVITALVGRYGPTYGFRVFELGEMPRDSMGKVSRAGLRALLCADAPAVAN